MTKYICRAGRSGQRPPSPERPGCRYRPPAGGWLCHIGYRILARCQMGPNGGENMGPNNSNKSRRKATFLPPPQFSCENKKMWCFWTRSAEKKRQKHAITNTLFTQIAFYIHDLGTGHLLALRKKQGCASELGSLSQTLPDHHPETCRLNFQRLWWRLKTHVMGEACRPRGKPEIYQQSDPTLAPKCSSI
jgi:hypothetical protein